MTLSTNRTDLLELVADVTPGDLADAVHAAADAIAAALAGDASDEDTRDMYAAELAGVAGAVNATGVPAQIEFLVEHLGEARARQAVLGDPQVPCAA